MTLKSKLFLVGGILIVGVVGFFWWRTRTTHEVVPTERVTRGTVNETISVTGELVPGQYADLSLKSVGLVEALWVKEGEVVKAGDPIARLDRAILEEQLRSARATLSIAEANERLARRDWKGLAPEERQVKILASVKARADVAAAEAALTERVLRAPFDGVITKLSIRQGETIVSGQVIARLVGQAPTSARLHIEAQIPESDVAKVRTGMRARVTFDALARDEVFEATVSELESSATVIQDVVSYQGNFELARTVDERLRDGMTANIDIQSNHRDNVLILPFRAIAREGDAYSVKLRDGDTFVTRPVKIGLEGDEGEVEILSGLQEGDEVAVTTKSQ